VIAHNTLTLGVTLMLHTGMWVFRSPYSDIATIYCTADVECHFVTELHLSSKWSSELIKSCNCKQKLSRRLWSSSDNCCTIWTRYGLNTKRLRRILHTVVFDIDSSLAAVPVDFFGLCRKLAGTRSTSSSAVGDHLVSACTDTQFQ
jgi:hypothetical protein